MKKYIIDLLVICVDIGVTYLYRKCAGLSIDFFSVIVSPIIGVLILLFILNTKWYKSKFDRK